MILAALLLLWSHSCSSAEIENFLECKDVDDDPSIRSNETCLYVEIIDSFGDGWGEDTKLMYWKSIDGIITSIYDASLTCECARMAGCLPVDDSEISVESFYFTMAGTILPKYFWEIQWTVQCVQGGELGSKYYGGYNTSLELSYHRNTGKYSLDNSENLWVYPEVCTMDPSSYADNLYHVDKTGRLFSYANESTAYTGSGLYITPFENRNEIQWMRSGCCTDGGPLTLSDGFYILRSTGSCDLTQDRYVWRVCSSAGGPQEELVVEFVDGKCFPHNQFPVDAICNASTNSSGLLSDISLLARREGSSRPISGAPDTSSIQFVSISSSMSGSTELSPSATNPKCESTYNHSSDVIDMISHKVLDYFWVEASSVLSNDQAWTVVTTTLNTFTSPVVFVGLPEIPGETSNEGYPAISRVRNIISINGIVTFETKIYQANDSMCSKAWHIPVPISPDLLLTWLVVDRGAYNITGHYFMIGEGPIYRFNDDVSNRSNFIRFDYPVSCVSSTESCAFDEGTPIGVILQLQTLVYDRLLIPRGFTVRRRHIRVVLQPHDSVDATYYSMTDPESLGFMAFETGIGISCVEGMTFETRAFDEVTNVKLDVEFLYEYSNPPGIFGTIGTSTSLTDSTGLRVFDRTNIGASVITQEDQCVDEETSHYTAEVVYTMVVGEQNLQTSCVFCKAVFFAEQPAPTSRPSLTSTPLPTSLPTTSPIATTSFGPSCFPTEHLTSAPSTMPTLSPTGQPSSIPSMSPISVPSLFPTLLPTGHPTSTPSTSPTWVPSLSTTTGQPISIPPMSPSSDHTFLPTLPQSTSPTLLPPSVPSTNPTLFPTPHRTEFPTSIPSAVPPNIPTVLNPTSQPNSCTPRLENSTDVYDMINRVEVTSYWLESGFVRADDQNWVTVSTVLTSFENIVIFVSLPDIAGDTSDDGFSAIARVRNVVSSGHVSFETRIYQANDSYCSKEWYIPSALREPIPLSWMVVEQGAFNLSGHYFMVGSGPISRQDSDVTNPDNFVRFNYPTGCVSANVSCLFEEDDNIGVILQLQTVVYDRILIPRGFNVKIRFAKVVLQPHDSVDMSYYSMPSPETLAYMAFETGLTINCVEKWTLETHFYAAVTHIKIQVSFNQNYIYPPGLYGTIGTSTSLSDSTGLRAFDRTISGACLISQEDQCVDDETMHTTEEEVFVIVVGEASPQEGCVICRSVFTSLLSSNPTTTPTQPPSASIAQPTSFPSSLPTMCPTSPSTSYPTSPSASYPTSLLSLHPSSQSTSYPTSLPTLHPSSQSTSYPTSPSASYPTSLPTLHPSSPSTSYPTSLPTLHPSTQSTSCPTSPSTSYPTSLPILCPSSQSTSYPSSPSTLCPSCLPTLCPSSTPTSVPSCSYTYNPSLHSTSPSSTLPSMLPSSQAIPVPSSTSLDAPSIIPLCFPAPLSSECPSVLPTTAPTLSSVSPTLNWDIGETVFPTLTPTLTITDAPSQSEIGSSISPSFGSGIGTTVEPTVILTSTPSSPAIGTTLNPTRSDGIESTVAPTSEDFASFSCNCSNISDFVTSDKVEADLMFSFFINDESSYEDGTARWDKFVSYNLDVPFSLEYFDIEVWGVKSYVSDNDALKEGADMHSECYHSKCPDSNLANEIVGAIVNFHNVSVLCGDSLWQTINGHLFVDSSSFPCNAASSENKFIVVPEMQNSCNSEGSVAQVVSGTVAISIRELASDNIPKIHAIISASAVDSSSVAIALNVSFSQFGGIVCVGAFLSDTMLSSISSWAVKYQGYCSAGLMRPLGGSWEVVTIKIDDLDSLELYDIYASATDSFGNTAPLDTGVSTTVVLPCCKELSFTRPFPLSVPSTLSEYDALDASELDLYTLGVELSSPPVQSIMVFLDIVENTGETANISYSPSFIEFGSGESNLIGYFLVHGLAGSYRVSIKVTGPGSEEFNVPDAVIVGVLDNWSDFAPPSLYDATFDESGGQIHVTLNSPSDFGISLLGGTDGLWECTKLFYFGGDINAACAWASAFSITVYLDYYEHSDSILVIPGDDIVLKKGVLQPYCPSRMECKSLFAEESRATVTSGPTAVNPYVDLHAADVVYACDDIIVDASQSSGSGGRKWKSIEWRVVSADGSSVESVLSSLRAQSDLSVPITIPSYAIRETTYYISLGLRNFLQNISDPLVFGTVAVTVRSGTVVSADISGRNYRVLRQTSPLHLYAQLLFSACNHSDAVSVSFKWRVYENLHFTDFVSSNSSNPSEFKVDGSVFTAGSLYRIYVFISTTIDGMELESSSVVSIYSVNDDANAVISGGVSALLVRPDSELILEAEPSAVDEAEYLWTCLVTSTNMFGYKCADIFGTSTTERTSVYLTLPSGTLNVNTEYLFTFTITSYVAGRETTSSAAVHVSTGSSLSPLKWYSSIESNMTIEIQAESFLKEVSPSRRFELNTRVHSSCNEGANVSWSLLSIGPSRNELDPSLSYTALDKHFSYRYVYNGISFPLGLYPDALAIGGVYIFRLTVDISPEDFTYADITVRVNDPPACGSLFVSPKSGESFDTIFTLSTSYWTDRIDDYPLRYKFAHQVSTEFDQTQFYSAISVWEQKSFVYTTLQSGLSVENYSIACGVFVADIWGSEVLSQYIVHVTKSARESIRDNIIAQLDDIVYSTGNGHFLTDLSGAHNVLHQAASLLGILHEPNCSSAPHCKALNREECATVSHTCGPCIEGFSGVFGDDNRMCFNSTLALSRIGNSCSDNDDCLYGECSNRSCVVPVKDCPLGKFDGSVCSSNGVCSYKDSHGTIIEEELCTVDNTNCIATCDCTTGGGKDCSLSDSELSILSRIRGQLCMALESMLFYIDDMEIRTETSVRLLSRIYDTHEVSTAESWAQCNRALEAAFSNLAASGTKYVPKFIVTDALVTLSKYFQSDFYEYTGSNSVDWALATFKDTILADMLAGQNPIVVFSDSLRLEFRQDFLSDFYGAVLKTPLTNEEIFYGAEAVSISIPESGLDLCGAFEDYAKLVVHLWNINPYDMDSDVFIQSSLLSIATRSTGGILEDITDINNYSVVFPSLTRQKWNTSTPHCAEYDLLTQSVRPCESCSAASYNVDNVTFVCNDAVDFFCPDSSSSGLVLSNNPDNYRSRRLQAGEGKVYFVQKVDDLVSSSKSDSKSSYLITDAVIVTGIATFFVLYLLGLFVLHMWDRYDRKIFVLYREEGDQCFDITAAFDDRGMVSNPGCTPFKPLTVSTFGHATSDFSSTPCSPTMNPTFCQKSPGDIALTFDKDESSFDFATKDASNTLSPIGRSAAKDLMADEFAIRREEKGDLFVDIGCSNRGHSFKGELGYSSLSVHGKEMTNDFPRDLGDECRRLTATGSRSRTSDFKMVPRCETNRDVIAQNSTFPATSFLSFYAFGTRFWRAIKRHHKFVRIFTYPSMRRTRVIRLLVVANDILFILFMISLFFGIFYPDNSRCQVYSLTTEAECLSDESPFEKGKPLCEWRSEEGSCILRHPPLTAMLLIRVSLIVLVFSIFPRRIVQFLLEKVCAKRPILEDVGLNSKDWLSQEPLSCSYSSSDIDNICSGNMNAEQGSTSHVSMDMEYSYQHIDEVSVSEEVTMITDAINLRIDSIVHDMDAAQGQGLCEGEISEKVVALEAVCKLMNLNVSGGVSQTRQHSIKKALRHARRRVEYIVSRFVNKVEVGLSQVDYSDMALLQEYILEQLSPIATFVIEKNFYEMDHATPGRLGFFSWVISWASVFFVWGFMAYWSLNWIFTNGISAGTTWTVVLLVVLLADLVVKDISQILFFDVIVADKVRPQLCGIYYMLREVWETRVKKPFSPNSDIRVIQHVSASCRASRNPALSSLTSARILRMLNDNDVLKSQRLRLDGIFSLGFLATVALYIPSRLSRFYDVVRQSFLDATVVMFWYSFVYLSHAIFLFSSPLLVWLYVTAVIIFVSVLCVLQSKWYKSLIGRHLSRLSVLSNNGSFIGTVALFTKNKSRKGTQTYSKQMFGVVENMYTGGVNVHEEKFYELSPYFGEIRSSSHFQQLMAIPGEDVTPGNFPPASRRPDEMSRVLSAVDVEQMFYSSSLDGIASGNVLIDLCKRVLASRHVQILHGSLSDIELDMVLGLVTKYSIGIGTSDIYNCSFDWSRFSDWLEHTLECIDSSRSTQKTGLKRLTSVDKFDCRNTDSASKVGIIVEGVERMSEISALTCPTTLDSLNVSESDDIGISIVGSEAASDPQSLVDISGQLI